MSGWRAIVAALSAPRSSSPNDVVKSAVARVTQLLGAMRDSGPAEARRARDEIRAVTTRAIDLGHMAHAVLGPHWKALTPTQHAEFVSLFTAFVERSYLAMIDRQRAFAARYVSEVVDGQLATVTWKISRPGGTELLVEYRLRLKDGGWKVYDVRANGIGFIASHRARCDELIRASSGAELLVAMRSWGTAPSAPADRADRRFA